jgi:TM2 domain-containing membrane protein YozV
MNGTIIDYDQDTKSGLVSGNDGVRYDFSKADFRQGVQPYKGMVIDFKTDGTTARDIFVVQTRSNKSNKSRSTYIILALFLGFLGIHDLYAGRYFWGFMCILVTVTSPLFGGLSLIGLFFSIVCEMFVITYDGNGKKFQ